jgi:hypothetical protein
MADGALRRVIRLLASLKVAIPLLVLLTVVTIVGSLFPDPDIFRSWWYLSLLGAQGPSILKRKGRNALLGVIATHLGILVIIAGIIYGGFAGQRHDVISSTSWWWRNISRKIFRARNWRRSRRKNRKVASRCCKTGRPWPKLSWRPASRPASTVLRCCRR